MPLGVTSRLPQDLRAEVACNSLSVDDLRNVVTGQERSVGTQPPMPRNERGREGEMKKKDGNVLGGELAEWFDESK